MKEQYLCRTSSRKFSRRLSWDFTCHNIVVGLLLAGLVTVTLGCDKSNKLEKLTGRVTASTDGSPLVGGRLIFHSAGTNNFSATTDENGLYSAGSITAGDGIAAGKYAVTIVEFTDLEHPRPSKINAKYSQVKTSGIQVDVPTKDDKFDIVLDPP